MDTSLQYQLRITLPEHLAQLARTDRSNPALRSLTEVLDKHQAVAISQLDGFEGYVAEAEKEGVEHYPLYKWTKATIEDTAKRSKHAQSFSLHVDGQMIYSKAEADALEADLQPLVGGDVVTRMTKHDSNPSNNPQMPAEYR